MVIFGAGGDLTRSKLIPALYNLAESRLLSDDFAVVAFARELEEAAFRDQLRRGIREHLTGEFQQRIWDWLDKRLYRVLGDFRDPEAYGRLKDLLDKVDGEHGTAGNYLYYMATPPSFFSEIPRQLNRLGLAAITESAMAERCPLCVEVLDLFIELYGAEAANLALKVMATGGVYLGGGIAPKIVEKLKGPTFIEAFLAKGRMRPLLEAIPVRVIMREGTALVGAARYAAELEDQ